MKHTPQFLALLLLAQAASAATPAAVDKTALEAMLASTTNPAVKRALEQHAAEATAAAAMRPHTEAVIQTVEGAKGRVEKRNTTPDAVRKAAGSDLPLFEVLTLVDLAIPNTGPHAERKTDPYDAAFFEHLGHLATLESLNIIATKLGDDGIAPIGKLTGLKALRFTNNGKLTDGGLAQLAGLKNLESFSFVGTGMQGHAYKQFEGWNKLTRVSHRGSSIDDEGIQALCEHLPNLESISLAHAKFTDAGAVHLAKLTHLKSLEIGTRNGTPACLANLRSLPLESLQLGDGLDSPAGIAAVRDIASLRRLTITNGAPLTDADLQALASISQLESLEFDKLALPEERIPQLAAFSFLKTLTFALRPAGYPDATQEKVRALLPKVELKFVR